MPSDSDVKQIGERLKGADGVAMGIEETDGEDFEAILGWEERAG